MKVAVICVIVACIVAMTSARQLSPRESCYVFGC